MNYDFEANWNDVILPLVLHHGLVKKAIKRGIVKYLKHFDIKHMEYSPLKPPAYYISHISWVIYMDEFEEQLIEKLIATGYMKEPPPIKEVEDEENKKYEAYRYEMIRPFVTHHQKTCMKAYQMFGCCHWWNPAFGLTLAKIIYPNEKWKVVSGEHHTTITNKDRTLVFDILYFDKNDETRGGKKALEDATKK